MSEIKFGTDGWRAIIAEDFTFANVRLVSQAIADHLKSKGFADKGIVIGYDNRFMAERFAAQVVGVMNGNGIKAFLPDKAVPTPATAFTVKELQAGGAIMLTASHNPAEYCGIKFIPHYAGPALPEDTDPIVNNVNALLEKSGKDIYFMELEEARGKGLVVDHNPRPAYFKHIENLLDFQAIKNSNLKVIVDPMYGAGVGYLEDLLDGKCEVIAIRDTRDPLFGGGLPDPSEKYLSGLKHKIKEEKADLGLALDGDADRLGVMDGEGTYYNPNQIIYMLLHYLASYKNYKGAVARTVATTHMLDRIAKKLGLELIETPVGFKFIGQAMRDKDAFIGGEESGGVSIKGHIPEKDGIMAGLLFIEMLANMKKSAKEIVAEIDEKYGMLESDRLDLHCTPAQKEASLKIMKEWQPTKLAGEKVTDIIRIDGVKILMADGNWALVRASGTEAVFRIYCEADSLEKIKKIQEAVRKDLQL